MIKYFFLLSLINFFIGCQKKCNDSEGDLFYDSICKKVAQDKIINKQYNFKVPQEKGMLEYDIFYLGEIKNSQRKKIKFLCSIVYTSIYEKDSPKAYSYLNIYDDCNCKLGYYYIGGKNEVPNNVTDKNVVFSLNNEDCNKETFVNFYDSIPSKIFVKCTNKGGNLWKFHNISN